MGFKSESSSSIFVFNKMRAFIFVALFCLLGLASARTTSTHSDIVNEVTCEDVLAEKVCASLREAAEAFKLKIQVVDELVREAVAKGITDAKAVIAHVRQQLIDMAKDFHCGSILPEYVCSEIAEVAAKVSIKMEQVEEFMKVLVSKGITKLKEIIEELKKHFFPSAEINAIVCEDVLADNVCKALREAAKMLKIKAAEVDKAIREALDKGLRKAKDIIKFVRAKIEQMVHDFKCEQVLAADVCAKIHEIAEKVKVDVKKVDEFIKKLVVKGITKIKEIIEKIKHHFFPDLKAQLIENVIVCEEVLADNVCKALREAAKILKIKIEEVDKAVREALDKGLTKAKEIIAFVRAKIEQMVHNFKCTDVLDEGICAKIHEIAALIKVDAAKVDAFIRDLVVKGITKAKEIIEAIKKHFFPGVEGELINVITCEDVLSADMCKKLRDAAEMFKIKAAEVDKMIRQAIAKGVTKAKEIFKIVQAKLIEMAKNFKCTDALSKDVCDKIAEVAGKLKVKMAEVMKVIKEIIVKGITKAKEIIEEIKKHFFPGVEGELINVITCEDVLSADMCKKLRDAAELFKIKAAEVDKMIRQAIAKGVTKAKEIFKIVQAKLIEMAKNFKC